MKQKGIFAVGLASLVLVLCLAGCGGAERGGDLKSRLAGSWYLNGEEISGRDGAKGPAFTLYDDGTCVIASEYGTGTWELVNENELKLTSFYGETAVKAIESLEDGCLTLEGGMTYLDSVQ